MLKISQKDKSLILLFSSAIIVLASFFSLLSYLISSISSTNSDLEKAFSANKKMLEINWLNSSRQINLKDLENRIVVLNFWNSSCVGCIQKIAEMNKIQKDFGSKVAVLSIHIPQFEKDKNLSSLKKTVIKHNINHLVFNDEDKIFQKTFNIKTLPRAILIDNRGNIYKSFVDESILESLYSKTEKLINKNLYSLNRSALPIILEKNLIDANILKFPTKIIYVADFEYKSQKMPVLIIANSGSNNIIISSISGEIIAEIGSKKAELRDGNFSNASFNFPQGLLYKNKKLYVADTANHALREVDFINSKVKTLIGSSQIGDIIENEESLEASSFDLSSPSDIEFFPNQKTIAIANSGANQILLYDIEKDLISALAGSGFEGMIDGKYPKNDLAQTSDLFAYNKKLYLLDAKSSSLRVIDEELNLATLIGKGVKKFGNKNGSSEEALMQNPKGLFIDDTGIFISDSLNNIVKKYDFSSKKIFDFFGSGKVGDLLNSYANSQFDAIDGIAAALNDLYIADSNNNRIVKINRADRSAEIVNIMPPLKLPKDGFLEYLPNLEEQNEVEVAANYEAKVIIDLNKTMKINELGPSFINLLELKNDSEANLIHFIDWQQIKSKNLSLPKLKNNQNYLLQGVIYYCENKQNSLCFVKSYEQKIRVSKDSKNQQLFIKIGY
jgi:thiol-disulfide isomerase/thioredoxin